MPAQSGLTGMAETLAEEPVLNNVPTWRLGRPEDREHVLAHLRDVVVKEVHGAGGYGMLVGPASTAAEQLPTMFVNRPRIVSQLDVPGHT